MSLLITFVLLYVRLLEEYEIDQFGSDKGEAYTHRENLCSLKEAGCCPRLAGYGKARKNRGEYQNSHTHDQ